VIGVRRIAIESERRSHLDDREARTREVDNLDEPLLAFFRATRRYAQCPEGELAASQAHLGRRQRLFDGIIQCDEAKGNIVQSSPIQPVIGAALEDRRL
jgi:hypothetical protein